MPKKRKNRIWTKARVLQSANLFSTRKEWSDYEPSAYRASIRCGWRLEATSHMKTLMTIRNFEQLKESALLYKTRNAWQQGDTNAYMVAMRRGLLDELCVHMPKIRNCISPLIAPT